MQKNVAASVKKLFRNKNFFIGFLLVAILITALIFSFFIKTDAYAADVHTKLAMPSHSHLLGTDHLGRDVFARVLKAVQVDFFIGFTTMLVSGIAGLSVGMIAGYTGGLADTAFMRLADVFMTIPGTIFVLVIVSAFGRGLSQTILAIALAHFPAYAKMIRAEVLGIKEREHIQWAKGLGAQPFRVMCVHILPDLVPMLLIISAMNFSGSIMAEAGLSYLGLGVQQPEPSLGNMLTRAQNSILINPFTAIVPGMVIIIFVLGFNLLSDGLRDVYNERKI